MARWSSLAIWTVVVLAMLGLSTIFGVWAAGLIAAGIVSAVLLPVGLGRLGKPQQDVDIAGRGGSQPPRDS
jgi:hypothetical protein